MSRFVIAASLLMCTGCGAHLKVGPIQSGVGIDPTNPIGVSVGLVGNDGQTIVGFDLNSTVIGDAIMKVIGWISPAPTPTAAARR